MCHASSRTENSNVYSLFKLLYKVFKMSLHFVNFRQVSVEFNFYQTIYSQNYENKATYL